MKRSVGTLPEAKARQKKGNLEGKFGLEYLGEGDVDKASGLDGEKDHETTNLKDILRRKLQEKMQNKSEKLENLDQLENWHKENSTAGFSVDI